jgi:hypothetical protein
MRAEPPSERLRRRARSPDREFGELCLPPFLRQTSKHLRLDRTGAIAFTVMPSRATSCARDLVKNHARLGRTVVYQVRRTLHTELRGGVDDPTHFFLCIAGRTRRVQRKTLRRLVPIIYPTYRPTNQRKGCSCQSQRCCTGYRRRRASL